MGYQTWSTSKPVIDMETTRPIALGEPVVMMANGDIVKTYDTDPNAIGRVLSCTQTWDDGVPRFMATVEMLR